MSKSLDTVPAGPPCPFSGIYDAGQCCGGVCFDDIATADVILNAVREQDVYVGDDSELRSVMIDGYLNLVAIAAAIRLRTVSAQEQPNATETNVNEQRT